MKKKNKKNNGNMPAKVERTRWLARARQPELFGLALWYQSHKSTAEIEKDALKPAMPIIIQSPVGLSGHLFYMASPFGIWNAVFREPTVFHCTWCSVDTDSDADLFRKYADAFMRIRMSKNRLMFDVMYAIDTNNHASGYRLDHTYHMTVRETEQFLSDVIPPHKSLTFVDSYTEGDNNYIDGEEVPDAGLFG